MQIGSVIRKHRLEKNMTQGEMAKRLGVTAPAVNKWERGNSMPDITLLPPIARLLDISVDTLLSHTNTLSTEMADQLLMAAYEKVENEPFEEVFAWAKGQLHLYPNSDYLVFHMAQILLIKLRMQERPDEAEYVPFFIDCYHRALESGDETLRMAAANALYYHYMGDNAFEKAEEYLDYFSAENPDRKLKLATVYSETGRKEEAQKMYEELLYSGYGHISSIFQNICHHAMKEKDFEKAHRMVEKCGLLANVFEMGEYHEASPGLELAMVEKDADRLFEIMQRLLGNVESISEFTQSSLYSHMKLNRPREDYYEEVRQSLIDCLKEDACAFVQDDARFDIWRNL